LNPFFLVFPLTTLINYKQLYDLVPANPGAFTKLKLRIRMHSLVIIYTFAMILLRNHLSISDALSGDHLYMCYDSFKKSSQHQRCTLWWSSIHLLWFLQLYDLVPANPGAFTKLKLRIRMMSLSNKHAVH
jgi:hypothetical protein